MAAKENTGIWLVAAALLSSWAVSSASDEAPRRDVRARATHGSALPPEAVDAAAQVARLAARTRDRAGESVGLGRNPFAFAGNRRRAAPTASAALRRGDNAVIAATIAAVAIETPAAPALAAVVEMTRGTATAVISFNGELHYAARGATIADRYRIDAIFVDAVDVFDLSLGTNLRLTLRSPR